MVKHRKCDRICDRIFILEKEKREYSSISIIIRKKMFSCSSSEEEKNPHQEANDCYGFYSKLPRTTQAKKFSSQESKTAADFDLVDEPKRFSFVDLPKLVEPLAYSSPTTSATPRHPTANNSNNICFTFGNNDSTPLSSTQPLFPSFTFTSNRAVTTNITLNENGIRKLVRSKGGTISYHEILLAYTPQIEPSAPFYMENYQKLQQLILNVLQKKTNTNNGNIDGGGGGGGSGSGGGETYYELKGEPISLNKCTNSMLFSFGNSSYNRSSISSDNNCNHHSNFELEDELNEDIYSNQDKWWCEERDVEMFDGLWT